jgi:hypothetical protein
MTEPTERRRREVPMIEQVLAWLTRAGVGLIVFFLLQIYTDIQGLKKDVAEATTDIAVLKERTAVHREGVR